MALRLTEAFTAIGARDFAGTVGFYRALLDREPDERIGEGYAAFRTAGLHLGIFAPKGADRERFGNPDDLRGGLSLVLGVADLEQAREILATLNPSRAPEEIQSTRHGRECYAHDPEGNRLILVERPLNSMVETQDSGDVVESPSDDEKPRR